MKARVKTLASLERRLEQKTGAAQRKVESYDKKILDCRARADALTVKMSGCNPTASFITQIWDGAATAGFTCTAANSILGNLLGTVEGTLDCAASCIVGGALSGWLGGGSSTDNSQCITRCQQKNEALRAKCKNKMTSTCSQIVRYRTKSEGYKKMKASYNPVCTGVSATACPNGTLRNIYIQIHGQAGNDSTGAKFEATKATNAAGVANASYECCQSGGTYNADTKVCTPKPTPTPAPAR